MSKKKIWSMPIAAFALALMLASALIATGIVQAQTPIGTFSGVVDADGAAATAVTTITIPVYDSTGSAPDGIVSATLSAHATLFTATANSVDGSVAITKRGAAKLAEASYEFDVTIAVDRDTVTNSDNTGTAADDVDDELVASVSVQVIGPDRHANLPRGGRQDL